MHNWSISIIYFNIIIYWILLVAIVKLENDYIREWVEYYKSIGINKIVICDNNNIGGEKIEEPIQDYIKSNFIIIGKFYVGKGYLQMNCYQNNYRKYYKEYDWVTFNDIDEFIFLEEGSGYTTIQQFLDEPIFNDKDNIILTWRYYDDNEIIDVENGVY